MTVRDMFRAALLTLRAAAAFLDVRDWHFYGGLLLAYLGARALAPDGALVGLGLVLMLTGLLYRGRR